MKNCRQIIKLSFDYRVDIHISCGEKSELAINFSRHKANLQTRIQINAQKILWSKRTVMLIAQIINFEIKFKLFKKNNFVSLLSINSYFKISTGKI